MTARDLIEVYEALPSHPWPARFNAQVVDDAIAFIVPEEALAGITPRQFEQAFADVGLPVRLAETLPAGPGESAALRPLRADLLETTFAGRK